MCRTLPKRKKRKIIAATEYIVYIYRWVTRTELYLTELLNEFSSVQATLQMRFVISEICITYLIRVFCVMLIKKSVPFRFDGL